MDNVSRPLIALLVGTVLFFVLWIVALKPSSPTGGNSSKRGLGQYQSAINAAHQAVKTSDQASVAHGGTVVTTPTSAVSSKASVPASSASTSATRSKPPVVRSHAAGATRHRLDVVGRALMHKHVVALLFYNPAATDDRAVKRELATVPTHHRRVVKLAVPISELARYPVVVNQVPVNQSPTLVLVDAQRQATTIVGFTDRFEIAQRVGDALAVK